MASVAKDWGSEDRGLWEHSISRNEHHRFYNETKKGDNSHDKQ